MKASWCVIVSIACLALGTSVHADPPEVMYDGNHWHFPRLGDLWGARQCCWCPDDYCPKALPTVPCVPKGCVNDYCAKKLPTVPCVPKGCVDDYCPKKCPLVYPHVCEPWYTCVPTDGCGPHKCCCRPKPDPASAH
jgi:hypothetical protein